MAAAIATDLICWLQLVALGGELAAVEPKRLRYRILRTCARLLRGQRRRRLPIPSTWPWAVFAAGEETVSYKNWGLD